MYSISTQLKDIINSNLFKINKVYITGIASAINNIDLYFEEILDGVKCEILKPFFVEDSPKINMKDYIEVNSATALALQGLGYGVRNINFKKKSFWENLPDILSADVSIGGKSGKNSSEKKNPFNINISTVQIKSWLTRGLSGVLILSIAYIGIATYINGQLKKKNEEAQQVENQIKAQISAMDTDKKKVDSKASEYATLTTNLRNATNQINDKNSYKNVIPTVLSEIMYTIPVEVQLTSIENTSDRKIVINAQSTKYEQLAYFKALLKSRGVLKPTSVVSSEAVKEGSIVKIVIEGELP